MSETKLNLETLRRKALRLLLVALWLQAPLVALAAWLAGAAILAPTLSALVIAGAVEASARFDAKGGQARIAAGVGLMASISLLVAVCAGQKIQVDLHMYYFAALALLVATCDWRVVVGGAVTVALHHIILNFVLPSLIYPGGSDLLRLALHAIILVLESAALVWVAYTVEQMFAAVAAEAARAQTAQHAAEASHARAVEAAAEADAAHLLHERSQAVVVQEDEATLSSLATALGRLAGGDLTYRISGALPAKAEPLRQDFNAAMTQMQDAMLAVANNAQGITSGSGEITKAADDLSRRTEHQAAALEETAAALDQITATVRKTADGSVHARAVVNTARTDADVSGKVVAQAVAAMGEIEQSSHQIRQIIGVIDEIAFQTNLLALNAGVEAARAGDAGRGFAVVASEVRSLAQRSADAAKEIKTLISNSTRQVETGVGLVAQTGQALQRIVAQVVQINDIVMDITASAEEQSTALAEVNTSVNQMDQVTQQNAAMVEQSTAASHSLAGQAQALDRLIGRFDLGQAASTLQPAPRPAARAAIPMMKTSGRGGAAVRAVATPAEDWQAF
ncbi:MAG: methyl-accepting chemotaxis protein [Caulobacteraceae bacterium]